MKSSNIQAIEHDKYQIIRKNHEKVKVKGTLIVIRDPLR